MSTQETWLNCDGTEMSEEDKILASYQPLSVSPIPGGVEIHLRNGQSHFYPMDMAFDLGLQFIGAVIDSTQEQIQQQAGFDYGVKQWQQMLGLHHANLRDFLQVKSIPMQVS